MNIQQLRLNELRDAAGAIDLFVCCVSYEDRCLDVANALPRELVRNAIVAENVNHSSLHGHNLTKLMSLFQGRATHAATSTEDPIRTADALQAALRTHASAKRVVVDISTFTHEALLILFKLLTIDGRHVEYVYAAAGEYSVGDPPEQKWLSRGIKEIRSVLGYPGLMVPSRRAHLIILAGFERERASELVRHYEPSVVSLGVSASQAAAERKVSSTLRAFFPTSGEFVFDCFNPVTAADAISSRIDATPDFNIVVAPMNTKLSTLGAGLLACIDDRVQLCYAQAIFYNHLRYSKSNGVCYWIRDIRVDGTDPTATRKWGARAVDLAGA